MSTQTGAAGATEWSIHEVARVTGTTSRTLRHYGDVGLLEPSRLGANGYRFYDAAALTRLQRILLLRELGVGIATIAGILRDHGDDREALQGHLRHLRLERERLDRQIAAVERTIHTQKAGHALMAENMFDGFDHTEYSAEAEQRWGAEAVTRAGRWWGGLSAAGRRDFRRSQNDIQNAFAAAHEAALPADSPAVQAIAGRHFDWITQSWNGVSPTAEQFVGIAELYLADDRFSANYGGVDGARFVRDAMVVFADGLR